MIKIEDLCISLKDFSLNNINLSIKKNEFFVLMGPTGAGKTVLLEAIAGLVPVKSGRILAVDRDITMLPPEKRNIAIAYQDYALFPHMNVYDNIGYGLRFHKLSSGKKKDRIHSLAESLKIKHLLERFPVTLSGGELQRTSLARGLAVEPEILLLDEPLSALDPSIKRDIRDMLKSIHKSTKTTFLMVTHDFSEALSLAERGALIHDGKIMQSGNIQDIFRKPQNQFVADFVGIKNIFKCSFIGTKALVNGLEVETDGHFPAGEGYIAIRPEDIVLSTEKVESSMRNSFMSTVADITDCGFYYEIILSKDENIFISAITKGSLLDLNIHPGSKIYISFKATAIHKF